MLSPSYRTHTLHHRLIACFSLAVLCALGLLQASAAHATNIILEWTAPGDDSTFGQATEYDLRYSLKLNQFPVRFYSAKRVPTTSPATPGAVERLVLADMPDGANIYFAMRTRDERGNWSRFSNTLTTQAVTDADAAGGGLHLAFSAAHPSPARGSTRFTLQLPGRSDATVEVIDVTGRRVRELWKDELDSGDHDLVWDLKDDAGRAMRAGVYFVRAKAMGEQFLRRVVVLQ